MTHVILLSSIYFKSIICHSNCFYLSPPALHLSHFNTLVLATCFASLLSLIIALKIINHGYFLVNTCWMIFLGGLRSLFFGIYYENHNSVVLFFGFQILHFFKKNFLCYMIVSSYSMRLKFNFLVFFLQEVIIYQHKIGKRLLVEQ